MGSGIDIPNVRVQHVAHEGHQGNLEVLDDARLQRLLVALFSELFQRACKHQHINERWGIPLGEQQIGSGHVLPFVLQRKCHCPMSTGDDVVQAIDHPWWSEHKAHVSPDLNGGFNATVEDSFANKLSQIPYPTLGK